MKQGASEPVVLEVTFACKTEVMFWSQWWTVNLKDMLLFTAYASNVQLLYFNGYEEDLLAHWAKTYPKDVFSTHLPKLKRRPMESQTERFCDNFL